MDSIVVLLLIINYYRINMDLEVLLPITTTLVSLFFLLSVSEQYYRKRQLHQLVWIFAMSLFFLTAGAFFSGFGYSTLYISEVFSIIIMYYGFLKSDNTLLSKFYDAVTLKYMWAKGSPVVAK